MGACWTPRGRVIVTDEPLRVTRWPSWATIGARTGTNGGFGVTAHIEHLSEVLKILDGALKANASMAANYAGLLADKLERDGQRQQARLVRERLARAPAALAHAQDASGGGLPGGLPVDADSRLHTVDLSRPTQRDGLSGACRPAGAGSSHAGLVCIQALPSRRRAFNHPIGCVLRPPNFHGSLR